jgi:branched-chain amino acid transport system substrate-binding protein
VADFAAHDLKMRKAAILYDSLVQPMQDFMLSFNKAFTGLGGQVVAQANYKWEATEFRDQLTQIGKAKPDFLFIPADTYKAVAQIAKEANTMGLKFIYFGDDSWYVDDLLTMAGKALEGSYVASGVSTQDPRFADYNVKFFKTHKVECQVAAYYAMDAIMALEYAAKVSIDKSKKIDTTVMQDALEHMKDVPVFTGTLTYDPITHNPLNKPMTIMTVKNAKWVIVKTVKPN